MATPFRYQLLPIGDYTSTYQGAGFDIGGRTSWTFTLDVAAVDTSVTVVVEAAAKGDDDWATLYSFGAKTTTAETVVVYTAATTSAPANFTVQPWHRYLRASVTAGDATLSVAAACAFLDPTVTADKALLSKELREWTDGLTRAVEQAEADVLELCKPSASGALSIDVNAWGASTSLRRAIAKQADWLYGTHMLGRSTEPAAQVSLRERATMAPGVSGMVGQYLPGNVGVWRGR